jgi:biopolymer transport protein ExbB
VTQSWNLRRFPSRLLSVALAALALTTIAPATLHAAAEQAAPDGAAPDGAAPDGFVAILFSGGIVGLFIILVLFALSLTAAYLVFEHLLTLRRKEIMPDGVSEGVQESLQNGQLAAAEKVCKEKPSFLSFVLLNGLSEVEGGWNSVEKAMEEAAAEQAARLFRRIEYLSVIGNIAPMVGLLGTVTGMIFAFQQVASSEGAAGAGELAEGIYQALVTTVGGLLVAIPSLGAFAVFRNRIDQLVAEAAYQAQSATRPLKRRARRNATTTPPTTPPTPPRKGS